MNRKELRSFVGTCNWLREYVQDFATTIAPLTDLLSEKKRYQWTKEVQTAFDAAKACFTKPLRLSRPNPTERYYLKTDASKNGMGALLYQLRKDGERNIISYDSAKFNNAETRYHSNEQECLAII